MKNFSILIVLMQFAFSSFSQQIIPNATRVHIDGIQEVGEWDDADELVFEKNDINNARVLFKHDKKNLLIAFFADDIPDNTLVMPEFFIDTKLNKGATWQDDDYWFHVSAQDCYAVGERENYENCRPDYTIWRASPNAPFGDKIEIINFWEVSVPLELLNVEPGNTIGICFSLAVYPQETRLNIPYGDVEDIPEKWNEFIISD